MSASFVYAAAWLLTGAGFAVVYVPLSRVWKTRRSTAAPQLSNTVAPPQPTSRSETPVTNESPPLTNERASELLNQLHEVASATVSDVEGHTELLEVVNTELENMSDNDCSEEASQAALLRTIARTVDANVGLKQQLDQRAQVIEDQARQIESQMSDPLTGIPNRGVFDSEIKRRLAEWKRTGSPMSLILLDIDRFKSFNDNHGHLAGDEVLKTVANAYPDVLHGADLPARYGGEEFTAMLPATKLEHAVATGELVRKAIEQVQVNYEGQSFKVTASVGVAQTTAGDDTTELIKRADAALYAAKEGGRNRVFFHDGAACRPFEEIEDYESQQAAVEAASPEQPTAAEPAPNEQTPEPLTSEPTVEEVTVADQPQEVAATDTDEPPTLGGMDPVTGLPDEAAFLIDLKRRIAQHRRDACPVALMVLQIDDCGNLKDKHGQPGCDLVMTTMRQFLSAAVREMDFVAKLSDDLFGALLPSCNLEGAIAAAERVRNAIDRCDLLHYEGQPIKFTVSSGLCEIEADDPATVFLDRAKEAVAEAASAGGNQSFIQTSTSCNPAAKGPQLATAFAGTE